MRTLQEIQAAIARLPEEERLALLDWIHLLEEENQHNDDPELLLKAKEGARQLDAGQGITLEEAYFIDGPDDLSQRKGFSSR